jgi:membrane-bound lytic murein transglycosylase B
MLFSKVRENVCNIFLSLSSKLTMFKSVSLICLVIASFGLFYFIPKISFSQTVLTAEQQATLRAELAGIEQEIKDQQKILDSKQQEGASISRDIAILDAKIKQAQLKIKAHEISIKNLGKDIVVKTNTITALSERINAGQESMAQIIQRTKELDDLSVAESFLSNKNISEFFIDLDNFSSIKQSLNLHLTNVKGAKKSNEVVKEELGEKRDKEVDAKINVEQEQAKIKKLEADKKKLLSLNKSEQQNYKTVISNKTKRANEIRNALFPLAGTSQKINFGTALAYAKEASTKTGVDPVFLLAVIKQETDLGSNVGQCYLTDLVSGSGKGINTGSPKIRVMHPTRDVPVFLGIVNKINLDYSKTRVSCWIPDYDKNKNPKGWGGAMGPAQFIPSTWAMFTSRLKNSLGYDASPWNPQDAFLASAMYLTDLGAVGDSYSSQARAACKYYGTGGATCDYSNSVMKKKALVQKDIDSL